VGFKRVEQRHEDAGIDAHSLSELALAHRAVVVQQAEKLELSRLEVVGGVRVSQAAHRHLTEQREQQAGAGPALFENATGCRGRSHLSGHVLRIQQRQSLNMIYGCAKSTMEGATGVNHSRADDSAPLIVRLVQGSLMAGHRAQKLFGSFSGPGLEGTAGFMEMLDLKPGRPWAVMAGLSEFGGGGAHGPGIAPPPGSRWDHSIYVHGHDEAHWGKPIWVTEGGAELPVLNIATSTALMFRGPDRYSLDRLLGIRLPGWLAPLGLAAILLTVLYAGTAAPEAPQQQKEGPRTRRARS
jgi:putative oxidoreductase